MKRAGSGALPKWLERQIERVEKERRANLIARPMRNLFDILSRGEAYEIDGQIVMRMPEIDEAFAEKADWVVVAPAIEGWVDCWQRIAPELSTYNMKVLAGRLSSNKPLSPRLVEQARSEFDETVRRLIDVPPDVVSSAITTTQIAWQFEQMQNERKAA